MQIEADLETLANLSLRSGVGGIGYRSSPHDKPNSHEWIQIDLAKPAMIDAVALVPILLRDPVSGFHSEGFPIQFKISAGGADDQTGTVLKSFDENSKITPRIAPLFIEFPATEVSWVRIEANTLSNREYDDQYLLQFAEILVFSDKTNVALSQKVTASLPSQEGSIAYQKRYAVDGSLPYLMDAAGGEKSLAFVCGFDNDRNIEVTVDLEQVQMVSTINLHLVDQSDTVPQTFSGDFGVARQMTMEGATLSDFSDAKLLTVFQHTNPYDIGPIISRNFSPAQCRFVRLTAIDPYILDLDGQQHPRFGLAEIEVLNNKTNLAINRPVITELQTSAPRSSASLTDGNNYFGKILPIREWLEQLAMRHDLEVERPKVQSELSRQYQQQQRNLASLIWLAAFLIAAIFATILISWTLRQREIFQIRERIAADLHDELGANIHAIGLLSDLAQNTIDSPQKTQILMQRLRELTQRTGVAANHCSNMLDSHGLFDDLETEVYRAADRILSDIQHSIGIEDDNTLANLKPQQRIDLYLFFKECITNVLRHAQATQVDCRLVGCEGSISVVVNDNGIGLPRKPDSKAPKVPKSLTRRARLLRAKVTAYDSEQSGTNIQLKMRAAGTRFFK